MMEARPFADDDISNDFSGFTFSDKTIRLGFIRKVFSILLVQLLITFAFICLFLYCEPVRVYSQNNAWLWIVAFVMTFVCMIVLACCEHVRRTYPSNFIFLGLFTICEGYLVGAISSAYEVDAVLIAVGVTAVVAFGLITFAMQTKYDFTACGGALLVMLLVLLCFGILAMIFRNNILNIVYSCLGALIFGLYLIFDVQMMLGGNHKYSISPEEYVFAALNLYLDIINLFLYLLAIIGNARN